MTDVRSQDTKSGYRLPTFMAAVWVVVFFFWFFSLDFDTGGKAKFTRWQLWNLVPELADFVDPPEPEPGVLARPESAHSGWQYLLQRLDLVAVAASILAGAWGAGHLVLRVVRPALVPRSAERTVFAFGLGLSALSLLTLAAGLAGALSRSLLGSLLAVVFATELVLRISGRFFSPFARGGRGRSEFLPSPSDTKDEPSPRVAAEAQAASVRPAHWIALASLAPFLLATVLGALLPSTDFDVNAYHFEGPKEFYQAGRISFLEHNVYTSFPFATEMLTLLAMVFEGDWYRGALAGKCLLAAFGPLTALALFAGGRRFFGTTAGLLAAIAYLSTPWIYRISTIAYAEGGLCFFLFASLAAVMVALDQLAQSKAEPMRGAIARQFLLGGLLAGSAMACKYPGFVSVVIPLFLVSAWTGFRRLGRQRWIMPAAFVLGTALTVGPWLIKNISETGNPVYPLAWRLFDGRDWDAVDDAKWRHAHRPPTYSLSSLAGLAIDVAARSNWDSPLLFAFAPLALAAYFARRRAIWLWAYVGWLFLTCWLFTHRIDRFWVPLLPIVALLAGVGAAWLWDEMKKGLLRNQFESGARRAGNRGWALAKNAIGCSAVFIPFVAAGLFNLELMVGIRGDCGYNDYLRDLDEAERFAAQFAAPELVWLNTNLPAGSKVLAVGDGAMFEARIPIVYNTVFDRSIFEQWFAARPGDHSAAADMRDAASIRKRLSEEGITHIYVNWNWILRYRSPGNYGYTDFVTPERFVELQRMGILGPAVETGNALMPIKNVDATWLPELESWGKSLVTGKGDLRGFVTFQVFPVQG